MIKAHLFGLVLLIIAFVLVAIAVTPGPRSPIVPGSCVMIASSSPSVFVHLTITGVMVRDTRDGYYINVGEDTYYAPDHSFVVTMC